MRSILYLDASAIVKRYIREAHSAELAALVRSAELVGTSLINKVEVAAAMTKAVRAGVLSRDETQAAVRVGLSAHIVERAAAATWDHVLRGLDVDAVHLATALYWQDTLGEPVVLATFDRQLCFAGKRAGLTAWPEDYATSL